MSLLKLIKDNKLELLNCHEKCKGTWSRIQKDQKSVIDYGIIKEADAHRIESVVIDENREVTPYRIANDIIYTDHCAILTEIDWRKIEEGHNEKYVIDLKKLKEVSGKQELEKIIQDKGNIKDKYKKWQSEVNSIISKCKRKLRNKRKKKQTC